jgi:hypothetical protein
MNERIKEIGRTAGLVFIEDGVYGERWYLSKCGMDAAAFEKFAKLIVKDCIDKIETYRIPVGNSAAGEKACEWTYDALKEIRDEIKQHFGVKK